MYNKLSFLQFIYFYQLVNTQTTLTPNAKKGVISLTLPSVYSGGIAPEQIERKVNYV